MITVYHGTTENRADQILKDGFISVTTKDNKRHCDTHLGYIYVTTEFYQAIDFSTRPERGLHDYPVVIFEIMIDEKELSPDTDEEKWQSTPDHDNGYKSCYIIERNLEIGVDVKRKYYKYFKDYKSSGKFMQDVQYGEIKITPNDKEWCDLQKTTENRRKNE